MSMAGKLTTIAQNEQKVFNAGYRKGKAEGGSGFFDERLDGIIALQNGYIGGGYKPSEGLEYTFESYINSFVVTDIGTCTDEIVVIPSEYEGYPVTGISNLWSTTMKELILPDSVSWTLSTVNNCTALERVVFGANFGSVNYWSFGGNINCKAYDFSRCQKIPTIDLYDNPDYDVFSNMPDDCKMLVPPHLLDEWKRATNWTMFADHIVAAESVADNGTSDEVYNTTEERLEAIEGNVSKVYEAGSDTGFEDGKKAEWSAFWDAYQNYGNRTDYQYAFGNSSWDDKTFKPKYDIAPKEGYSGTNMFWGFKVTNLAETLEKQGVKLDTSKCGYALSMFQNAKTKRIPVLDFSNLHTYGSLQLTFINSSVETIDKIIVTEHLKYSSAFQGCTNLINITFEGVIGQNGLSLENCTQLSEESFISVINCLSDTTSGLSVTFSKAARTNAFTDDEWAALIATKPNWTISLV